MSPNTLLNRDKIIKKSMCFKIFLVHFQVLTKKFGYTKYKSVSVTELVATDLIFFGVNWWAKKQKSP